MRTAGADEPVTWTPEMIERLRAANRVGGTAGMRAEFPNYRDGRSALRRSQWRAPAGQPTPLDRAALQAGFAAIGAAEFYERIIELLERRDDYVGG